MLKLHLCFFRNTWQGNIKMINQKSVWFMEGVSSQRDILTAVKKARAQGGYDFQVIASHRSNRPEILAEADHAYLEPVEAEQLLSFMQAVIARHNVVAVHAGKRGARFEALRPAIESMGIKLTTGATATDTFELADDKARFSQHMNALGLPAVPSEVVKTADEVSHAVERLARSGQLPCIKPVKGIYGMGFWIMKTAASRMQGFNQPDSRIVHPHVFVSALRMAEKEGEALTDQIVMPYLASPEHSVDMLVEKGRVIAAVSRAKTGSVQTLENHGAAWSLAVACAESLQADGLINVQTRNNEKGEPVLLEANLRPSGGIGYTLHTGINLPGLFVLRQLGLLSPEETAAHLADFVRVQVTPTHAVSPVPACTLCTLDNSPATAEGTFS